jgi:hypothetical protein
LDAGTTSTETRSSFYFEMFLVALAVILLEISYTRIFSFKVFYYFTYLIIGIAILGLGSGGVLVAIFPRLRGMDPVRARTGRSTSPWRRPGFGRTGSSSIPGPSSG